MSIYSKNYTRYIVEERHVSRPNEHELQNRYIFTAFNEKDTLDKWLEAHVKYYDLMYEVDGEHLLVLIQQKINIKFKPYSIEVLEEKELGRY